MESVDDANAAAAAAPDPAEDFPPPEADEESLALHNGDSPDSAAAVEAENPMVEENQSSSTEASDEQEALLQAPTHQPEVEPIDQQVEELPVPNTEVLDQLMEASNEQGDPLQAPTHGSDTEPTDQQMEELPVPTTEATDQQVESPVAVEDPAVVQPDQLVANPAAAEEENDAPPQGDDTQRESGVDEHAAEQHVHDHVRGHDNDNDNHNHNENHDQSANGGHGNAADAAQPEDEDDSGDDDVHHNANEYDPANPTHDANEYDSMDPHDTTHAQDEYDPANPSEGFSDGSKTLNEAATSPARKRKLSDAATVASAASPAPSSSSTRSPKRPRSNSSSKPDHRGLKDSAWDRLVDFESAGEFRIAQVSRAAFSSIALLPEFAQCAIVARFTRTPMKDIRDKNGLIMRLHHEYLSENPHVSSLQPVSAFVDDATADRGLFTYGYAPPVPRSGMSSAKIPFRKDKAGTITTPSAPSASSLKLKATAGVKADASAKLAKDEFGREIKSASPREGSAQPMPASAVAGSQQVVAVAAPAGKPSDPRRRRSGGSDTSATDDVQGKILKSDVYNRLPISVKSRLDGLIAARRLPEALNDNVLSRLNHLPEVTALTAIDKFVESDLRQVGNMNGFLVGIINRVQDRGPSADRRVSTLGSATAAPVTPGTSHQHQQICAKNALQHVPHTGHAPAGYPHSLGHAGNHPHDAHAQPSMAIPPVGYGGHAAPEHAHTRNSTHAASSSHQPQGVPPSGGRFSTQPTIDRAVAVLPGSVQNHLVSLVNSRILPSLNDLSEKCYEVLAQLSEGLANDVLKRFGTADLRSVRNLSAFLVGVVKKVRQEYGFD